jgi:lysophospholipase L1-like esterase
MQGKLKKLKDNNGQYVYPVSVSEAIFVESSKTLKTKLSEMEQNLGGGSTENKLSGKKWAVLGDSVTAGGYWDNSTGVETVGTAILSYHQQIATKTGLVPTNYGIGGTCITDRGNNDGMCIRYTSMRDDAEIITVFGGINDYAWAGNTPIGTFGSSDVSTIYGAMKVLCEGLLQKYPGKPIGFIIPFPFNEYKGAGTWKPYYDAIVASLNYYAIPYCDLYKESMLNANIDFINQKYFKFTYGTTTGDKTHPNTNGMAIIARPIKSFLEKIVW